MEIINECENNCSQVYSNTTLVSFTKLPSHIDNTLCDKVFSDLRQIGGFLLVLLKYS